MNTKPKTRKIRPLAYFLPLIIIFVIFNFSFLIFNFVFASSPDAIAIRVIPNPNHYSPSRWYTSQGFTGSPQSLTVDGYDAVRDGRTVYVNAANISGTNLYTNIYLISYNQDAESATADIFSQLLSHWKFNTNISQTGSCFSGSSAYLGSAGCSGSTIISGINSSQVNITEALPKYDLGKDVTNYSSAFNAETKTVNNRQVEIILGDVPVFIEESGGQQTSASNSFDSPFGFHHATGLQDYSDDLGVKWVRLVSPWGLVQDTNNITSGAYDWDALDNIISDYSGQDINFMITISLMGTPVEASGSYVPNEIDYSKENYLKYVKEMALRYKLNIKYYQVENEPKTNISNFAELQKITYEAVKEVCSDCYVLNGGFGYRSFDIMADQILPELNGQYIDIFDFHFFGSANDTPASTVAAVRSKLSANNFGNIPIWITETGTYSGDPETPGTDYQTEKQQASSLIKRYVSSLAAGVNKAFWAWGIKEGYGSPEDGDYWDFTGFIYDGKLNSDQGNNVKKLSYYTYKKLTSILEGSDWGQIEKVRENNNNDGIYVYKFTRAGKLIWVAWDDNGASAEAVCPAESVNTGNNSNSSCLSDFDCPEGDYCSSSKAGITRDTKRLADLKDIETALENYKNQNNHYPILSSGTYLTNKTISTWPSWQEKLGQELGVALPLDPVNKLGPCDGYDSTTCWNDQASQFAGTLPDNLPENSKTMVYSSANNGTSYTVCAVMESGYLTDLNSQNACAQSNQTPLAIAQSLTNNPPSISGPTSFTLISGQPLNVFTSASDPNNDVLNWTINTSLSTWDYWSAPPALSTSGVPQNQRKIIAANAGAPGTYTFSITVSDNRGGTATKNYTINVEPGTPPTINSITNKTYAIGKSISNFTITATDPDSQYPLNFSITGLPVGLSGARTSNTNFVISGTPDDQTKDYAIALTVRDKYGTPSYANFQITIENNPPAITTTSLANATGCVNYTQNITASDPDGHDINFTATGLPNGLNINASTGQITGKPQVSAGSYSVIVTATDEYSSKTTPISNAQISKNYTLTVNNETFAVNSISNSTIYGWQDNVNLYHLPITYFGNADATTANSVVYTLTNNPSWLAIDSSTGEMQGTPLDNTPNFYNITITATNACGVSASTNFTLTILANEWCGDSGVNGSEQCDDQNNTNGDGCSSTCAIESGWSCSGAPSSCSIVCGDGIKMGTEQCDDNNTNNNDGCSSTCNTESGWACSGSPSACETFCGDGIKAGTEECDDGNATSGDGCDGNCQAACINPSSGIITWWPGEDNANDLMGNYNGTESGVTYASGKVGRAFYFGSGDERVNFGGGAASSLFNVFDGDYSFDFWFNAGNLTGGQKIFTNRDINDQFFDISLNNDKIIYTEKQHDSLPVSTIWSNSTVTQNTWTHVGIVHQGSVFKLYVNGNLDNTLTESQSLNVWTGYNVAMGAENTGGQGPYNNGLIDEFRMYDRALTESQIKAIYNADSYGVCR